MESSNSQPNTNIVENAFKILQEDNGAFVSVENSYATNNTAVLLLGNTGCGKSTLCQFIAGNINELSTKEIEENSNEFIIEDRMGRISRSTINSYTRIPELWHDSADAETFYFDCPGFSDTRSSAHEISATYYTKRTIDLAAKVKIVLLINYGSVRSGISRRNDFLDMLRHVAALINDVGKFRDGISLIVTKVDNNYRVQRRAGGGNNNDLILSPDDMGVKRLIGQFLVEAKNSIENDLMTGEAISLEQNNVLCRVKMLIDIFLLQNNDGQFIRIGIFRRPNTNAEQLSQIDYYNDEKCEITKIIHENTKYIDKSTNDFGYTLSSTAKLEINNLVIDINLSISEILSLICDAVVVAFVNKETECENIDNFLRNLQVDLNLLTDFRSNIHHATTDFPKNLKTLINGLKTTQNMQPPADPYSKLINQFKYFDFIKQFRNLPPSSGTQNIYKTADWIKSLNYLTVYLENSIKWFEFLNNLYASLCSYAVQCGNKKQELQIFCQTNYINKIVENSNLNSLLDRITATAELKQQLQTIKTLKINEFKAKCLDKVIDETLNVQHDTLKTVTSDDRKTLTIYNEFIKMSDIKNYLTNQSNIENLFIFSFHTIFFDANLNMPGVNMTIISPTWSIINECEINLDGKRSTHTHPVEPAVKGADGQPGSPGGQGGHFVGIGKQFLNTPLLTVSTNGGQGGDGQSGAGGKTGAKGQQAPYQSKYPFYTEEDWTNFEIKYGEDSRSMLQMFNPFSPASDRLIRVYGKDGEIGGPGGNGGVSGLGGLPGTITITNINNENGNDPSRFIVRKMGAGARGNGGKGGTGGITGPKGDTIVLRKWLSVSSGYTFADGGSPMPDVAYSLEYKYTESNSSGQQNCTGKSGKDNHNSNGLQAPTLQPNTMALNVILNNYRAHLNRYKAQYSNWQNFTNFFIDFENLLNNRS